MTGSNESSDDHPSASAGATRPRGRRSVAFGAAVVLAAVLIGGSGGAGAASLLTGKNIRDDSLRSADFRDSSIGAGKVRDGGLSQADVGFDLTGAPGDPGVQGDPGLPGVRAITLRTGTPVSRSDVGTLDAIARCATGEIALSGGAQLDAADPGTLPYILWSTGVGLNAAAWRTFILSPAGFKQYTPWVVCARVS